MRTDEAPWPVMADAAYHGLAGEVVKTIEPHSEADPVALLLQVLVLAGSVIGRLPHYQVESDRHHANLFCVLVGASANSSTRFAIRFRNGTRRPPSTKRSIRA
jgi:hypothetical protein